MHGLVLLDADNRVLRPAILWNDQRTAHACDEIREALGRDRLIALTGNDAVTGLTAPKLVWVRDHEPDVWRATAHVLLPKDYVRLSLTGEHALDKADGAGTLLFDLAARDWSPEVLDALRIPREWLPATHEGPDVTGSISAAAAEATGLRAGTPVVAGGGDQSANAVGVGAVSPGHGRAVAGHVRRRLRGDDRAALRPAGPRPRVLPRGPGPVAPHVRDALGGGLAPLAPRHVRAGLPYAELVEPAAAVPAGSEGLWFLPYLSGERSPHPDPLARGAFVGLTLAHDRRHLVRAVLEGVAFGLRDGLDLMVAAGMPAPAQVRASGGGLASPVWRQILADVLEAEIATVNTTEGAAFGAALLATPAAGWFPTVDDAVAAFVRATPIAAPGPDAPALPRGPRRVPRALPRARAVLPPATRAAIGGAWPQTLELGDRPARSASSAACPG